MLHWHLPFHLSHIAIAPNGLIMNMWKLEHYAESMMMPTSKHAVQTCVYVAQSSAIYAPILQCQREPTPYYSNLISLNKGNQKALHEITNSLLSVNSVPHPLPSHTNMTELANKFNHYSIDKIHKLRSSIPPSSLPIFSLHYPLDPEQEFSTITPLSSFVPTNKMEVISILTETEIKTSPADPLPSCLSHERLSWHIFAVLDVTNQFFFITIFSGWY